MSDDNVSSNREAEDEFVLAYNHEATFRAADAIPNRGADRLAAIEPGAVFYDDYPGATRNRIPETLDPIYGRLLDAGYKDPDAILYDALSEAWKVGKGA